RSDQMPIRQERSTLVVFRGRKMPELTADGRNAVDKLLAAAEQLVPADGSNLFGDWCIADTDLSLMLNRLVMNGDDVTSRIATYATRQWQRPSVQKWMRHVAEGMK